MADSISIGQLPSLALSQVTNNDIIPIINELDGTTYYVSLQNLDNFVKNSKNSSKFFSGSISNATFSTSSLTSSYLNYTGINNGTASYSIQSLSGSYANLSNQSTSASYALIAEYANSINLLVINTASLSYTTNYLSYSGTDNGTASYAINALTSSNSKATNYTSTYDNYTGINLAANYSLTANTASYANTSVSSSYADVYINNTLYQSVTSSILSSSYSNNANYSFFSPGIITSVGIPETYGAVGDGVTDDWIAIKNCVLSHSIVQFDAKTYAVRGHIPVPSNTIFQGKGIGQTILKIIDNSPYGYSTGIRMFNSMLLPETISWQTGVHGETPNGVTTGYGTVVDYIGDNTLSTIISGSPGRWSSDAWRNWERIDAQDYLGPFGARQNVLFKDFTIDGNFDNQARHSSFNWYGNPVGYFSPIHSYKVRATSQLMIIGGQNLIAESIEIKNYGAGFAFQDYPTSDPSIGGHYYENFPIGLWAVNHLGHSVSGGYDHTYGTGEGTLSPYLDVIASFKDSPDFPYPPSVQSKLKPNRLYGCVASNGGNPDYQNPSSNQSLMSCNNALGFEDLYGRELIGASSVDLLSSCENCYASYPYPRTPSTASIWNGNILSYWVSSSYTYENLLGSYDGTISGNGYLTGSLGHWAISDRGKMKKIDDGSPYGRWELRSGEFEYFAQVMAGVVTKNNFIRGMSNIVYTDTWKGAFIADGNTYIDVGHGINLNISPGCATDIVIIKNNYIQLLDESITDSGWSDPYPKTAISIGAGGDFSYNDNLYKQQIGEVIIQNNTIRMPAATTRYWQQYFPNINRTVGDNAPWELQNFSGSITGTIVGYDSGSNTSYSGTYAQSFSKFSGQVYGGSTAIGSAFYDKVYNLFQLAFGSIGAEYYKDSKSVKCSGISLGTLSSYTSASHLVVTGNTFINFNSSKVKGWLYHNNSARWSDGGRNGWFNSIPIGLGGDSGLYATSSTHVLELNKSLDLISKYCFENNCDDQGSPVPLAVSISDYVRGNENIYNMPAYNKDRLFIERKSITTPDIDYTRNILSYPTFGNNNTVWSSPTGIQINPSYGVYFGFTNTGSVLQKSSSFTNQLKPNTTYILNYTFFTEWNVTPANVNYYTGPVTFNFSDNPILSASVINSNTASVVSALPHGLNVNDVRYLWNFSPSNACFNNSVATILSTSDAYTFTYPTGSNPTYSGFVTGSNPSIGLLSGSHDIKFKIGNNSLFTWTSSVHNIGSDHRIFFTTTGSLSNPTGDFTLEATSSGYGFAEFSKISIFEYYPTASINFNIKNTIINLDDNLNISGFTNTGSYITGTYADVNNTIGNNILPRNDEINVRIIQPTSSFYNVTWPNNIIWLKNTNAVISSSIVNYKFKCDKGQIYGNYDLEQWSISSSNIYYNTGNVGIGTSNPTQKLQVAGTITSSGFITPISSSLISNISGSIFYSSSKLWVYTGTTNNYGAGVGWSTASFNA